MTLSVIDLFEIFCEAPPTNYQIQNHAVTLHPKINIGNIQLFQSKHGRPVYIFLCMITQKT